MPALRMQAQWMRARLAVPQAARSTVPAGAVDGAAGTATDAVGSATDAGTAGAVDGAVGSATDAVGAAAGALPTDGGLADAAGAVNGNLLNVNVDLAAQADIAAPINGAVAANANVAAPIDAAVAANIGSIDSNAFAVSQQDAIINQNIEGEATATADQQSDLKQ